MPLRRYLEQHKSAAALPPAVPPQGARTRPSVANLIDVAVCDLLSKSPLDLPAFVQQATTERWRVDEHGLRLIDKLKDCIQPPPGGGVIFCSCATSEAILENPVK
jgi:hypothetical protein